MEAERAANRPDAREGTLAADGGPAAGAGPGAVSEGGEGGGEGSPLMTIAKSLERWYSAVTSSDADAMSAKPLLPLPLRLGNLGSGMITAFPGDESTATVVRAIFP